MKRWPLVLIAAPAAVAVWSGWVGLGTLCGFGLVHPLPGIADGFQLNTAITLPIGVEAYGAYALGAWLTPGTPGTARRFAKWSAIGALALGMLGQVVYHILVATHATRAPWPVVALVSCLPVVTLGMGAALAHLLRSEPAPSAAPAEATESAPEPAPIGAPGSEPQSEPGANDTANPGANQVRRPSDLERRARRLLARRPDMTGADLGRALAVSPRTGQKILKALKAA